MFDAVLRKVIDPVLDRAGRLVARTGIHADALTLLGFATGMAGAAMIAIGSFRWALGLILLSRVLDGLDGAVARATKRTDRGGFLDITLDFFFYAAVPLAFAAHATLSNTLPAALLLASFYMNGTAFLAYAIMAAKRGQETTTQGQKSLYYMTGLAEGGETIALFVLCCLFPALFPVAASLFALVCMVSAVARVIIGWRTLG